MECNICNKTMSVFTTPVILKQFLNRPFVMCPVCAGHFIERLSVWKDFDLAQELEYYRTHDSNYAS